LDYLVDMAKTAPGIAGSRMMGGGFGGCTINIVEEKSVDSFVDFMQESYKLHFSVNPEVYVMQLEDGVKEL
jgi:galactokinase